MTPSEIREFTAWLQLNGFTDEGSTGWDGTSRWLRGTVRVFINPEARRVSIYAFDEPPTRRTAAIEWTATYDSAPSGLVVKAVEAAAETAAV